MPIQRRLGSENKKNGNIVTVWKFHDYSITHILREINFGDSRSAKSAIFAILEALIFDFQEFSVTQILREINFGDSRSAKSAIFGL